MPGGDTPQSVEKSWNQGCSFDRLGFRWIAFPLKEKTNSSPPKIGLKSPPKGKDHLRSSKIYFKKYMTSNKLWDIKSGKVFFFEPRLSSTFKTQKKSRETIKLRWKKKHLHVGKVFRPIIQLIYPRGFRQKKAPCVFFFITPRTYSCEGFLEKNADRLPLDTVAGRRYPMRDWHKFCAVVFFLSNNFLIFFKLWNIKLMIFSGESKISMEDDFSLGVFVPPSLPSCP